MEDEFYNVIENDSKDYSDRYRNCSKLEDKEDGSLILSTREISDVPESPNDIYHRVQSNEVNRLDLIAHLYYKNPLLWWVIAQANDIRDPFSEIEVGDLLRIPSIETLYGNDGILL